VPEIVGGAVFSGGGIVTRNEAFELAAMLGPTVLVAVSFTLILEPRSPAPS
jgi:hypothetical protein